MFASAVYPCVIEFTLKSEHDKNKEEKAKNVLSLSNGGAEDGGEEESVEPTTAAAVNASADHIQSETEVDNGTTAATVRHTVAVSDSPSSAVEDSSSVAESFVITDSGIAGSSDQSDAGQQGTQDVQKGSTSSSSSSAPSSPPKSKAQPPKRTTKIMFKSGNL